MKIRRTTENKKDHYENKKDHCENKKDHYENKGVKPARVLYKDHYENKGPLSNMSHCFI